MNLSEIFASKQLKPKERTEQICAYVKANPSFSGDLLLFAKQAKDPVKACCLEVFEILTKTNPAVCSAAWFDFAVQALSEKSPAVKRESARLIGNTVAQHPTKLDAALTGLLNNSEHEGTVVRWAAAFAIGEIIQLKTLLNKDLIPVAEAICEREEKASIQKIYQSAIKKVSR